jgi:hypothetical protein
VFLALASDFDGMIVFITLETKVGIVIGAHMIKYIGIRIIFFIYFSVTKLRRLSGE